MLQSALYGSIEKSSGFFPERGTKGCYMVVSTPAVVAPLDFYNAAVSVPKHAR